MENLIELIKYGSFNEQDLMKIEEFNINYKDICGNTVLIHAIRCSQLHTIKTIYEITNHHFKTYLL